MNRIDFVYSSNNETLIGIDGKIPDDWYGKKVRIEGVEYEAVQVYDMPNHVAIKGKSGKIGQSIEFI